MWKRWALGRIVPMAEGEHAPLHACMHAFASSCASRSNTLLGNSRSGLVNQYNAAIDSQEFGACVAMFVCEPHARGFANRSHAQHLFSQWHESSQRPAFVICTYGCFQLRWCLRMPMQVVLVSGVGLLTNL